MWKNDFLSCWLFEIIFSTAVEINRNLFLLENRKNNLLEGEWMLFLIDGSILIGHNTKSSASIELKCTWGHSWILVSNLCHINYFYLYWYSHQYIVRKYKVTLMITFCSYSTPAEKWPKSCCCFPFNYFLIVKNAHATMQIKATSHFLQTFLFSISNIMVAQTKAIRHFWKFCALKSFGII